MSEPDAANLPLLPLLLFRVPAGLEMMLAQEGVAFERVDAEQAVRSMRGRFVVFDGDHARSRAIGRRLGPNQIPIDISPLRRLGVGDPFKRMVDQRAIRKRWSFEGKVVHERVARSDKARARQAALLVLRQQLEAKGGVWMRLAPYPHPYRTAFNFRVDLDEPEPNDYASFASARRAIAQCTTHFVCTSAYAQLREVMRDLSNYDTQSHGHHHFVYRDKESNRRNLETAHRLLLGDGICAEGFAAPSGRWNAGLDDVLEELGYIYSSDFQLHYDDWPAFPWRGDRFSRVLQVPIHPVCEGLFLECGCDDPQVISAYLRSMLKHKIASGEPAFLYGHTERRLGRFPQIVQDLAEAVAAEPGIWRTTLTEFARWWTVRASVRWSLARNEDETLAVYLENPRACPGLVVEIETNTSVASIPVEGRTMKIDANALQRRPKQLRFDAPAGSASPPHLDVKALLRRGLDWETVTPTDELPTHTIVARWKKRLRRWREVPRDKDSRKAG